MLYFFHLCFIVCLNCANFLYMYWYILPSRFLSLSISLLLPFHIHCSPFSFQPCEQGKKLKRIHWVANIGTALKFLEGRKVRVHRLLFMCFSLSFFLTFLLLSLLIWSLVGANIESWPRVTRFSFLLASHCLHIPTSFGYPEISRFSRFIFPQRLCLLNVILS